MTVVSLFGTSNLLLLSAALRIRAALSVLTTVIFCLNIISSFRFCIFISRYSSFYQQ